MLVFSPLRTKNQVPLAEGVTKLVQFYKKVKNLIFSVNPLVTPVFAIQKPECYFVTENDTKCNV